MCMMLSQNCAATSVGRERPVSGRSPLCPFLPVCSWVRSRCFPFPICNTRTWHPQISVVTEFALLLTLRRSLLRVCGLGEPWADSFPSGFSSLAAMFSQSQQLLPEIEAFLSQKSPQGKKQLVCLPGCPPAFLQQTFSGCYATPGAVPCARYPKLCEYLPAQGSYSGEGTGVSTETPSAECS